MCSEVQKELDPSFISVQAAVQKQKKLFGHLLYFKTDQKHHRVLLTEQSQHKTRALLLNIFKKLMELQQ